MSSDNIIYLPENVMQIDVRSAKASFTYRIIFLLGFIITLNKYYLAPRKSKFIGANWHHTFSFNLLYMQQVPFPIVRIQ